MARTSDLVEGMAVAGAIACLAHCLALPLLFAVLPAMASIMPVPTAIHLAALAFAVPTTLLALWGGHRRHHRPIPALLGIGGLMLLAVGVLRFGETPLEVPLTIGGSLGIASAHLLNWRWRRTVS